MRLHRLAPVILLRTSRAGLAVVLVLATVTVVVQSTVGVGAVASTARSLLAGPIKVPPQACRLASNSIPQRRALVLWDDKGPYAAYGAQAGALAANLVSRFAQPVRQPVSTYWRGEMAQYAAVVYVGTNDGEPLPAGFLSDVRAGVRPVFWHGENAWQLTDRAFARAWGWRAGGDYPGHYTSVLYHGVHLTITDGSLGSIDVLNPAKTAVLGTATAADGTSVPWAVRSQNLTYVSEGALDDGNADGEDRSYAVADLMAGMFGPVRQRHRILLRLEDLGSATDPGQLRQIADLLAADHVPFSVAVYPMYLGPVTQHPRQRFALQARPQVVTAIRYMLAKGGTLVLHGYTHQLGGTRNPNDGESGQDYEFLRVHYNARHEIVYDGPVGQDAVAWARLRIDEALAAIRAAGLPRPEYWQFPEYGASPAAYRVAASMFLAQFGRGNYAARPFGHEDLKTLTEQAPPYLVRDVYGGPVLPETLGYVVGPQVPAAGPGSVRAILAAAAVQEAAVRDNVAGVYYHPFLGTGPLRRLVAGLRQEGYQFVSPCAVLRGKP